MFNDFVFQTNYGDFTFGNREQRRSNQAPEVIPSKWEPPLNMEPLLLGGRHVVTEFVSRGLNFSGIHNFFKIIQDCVKLKVLLFLTTLMR